MNVLSGDLVVKKNDKGKEMPPVFLVFNKCDNLKLIDKVNLEQMFDVE